MTTTEWPEYESHKVVRAAKIVVVEDRPDGRLILVRADGTDDELEQFTPTVPGMADKAEVGGWAMLYPDGFKSISPAKPFEEGYRRRDMSAAQLGANAHWLGLPDK